MQINLGRGLVMAMVFIIAFSSCDRIQKTVLTKDAPNVSQTTMLTITGGNPGGSFSPFAMAISDIVTQSVPHLEITFEASPGSVENTRRVNANSNYLGVAFASESYLGYHGQEVFAEEGSKTNLRAVTLLYIAYAQVIVLADSDIHQFTDFVGKKIATGRLGSGSAQTLERLARSTGIWEQITPVYTSTTEGADDLRDTTVDVFQWLVSVPNDTIMQLTTTNDIRMIDMDTPAQASGFYEQYPFYQPGTLSEGVYGGKVEPVRTLLMPTLLIAHKEVPAETVYAILEQIYTPAGLQAMITATGGASAAMTVENASKAFVIPLHHGAHKFWSEQGAEIPAHAIPVD